MNRWRDEDEHKPMTLMVIGWIIGLALSLSALTVALLAFSQTRRPAVETDKLIQRLTREVAAASSGSVGMGQRLLAMEKRVQASADKKAEKIDYYNDDEF